MRRYGEVVIEIKDPIYFTPPPMVDAGNGAADWELPTFPPAQRNWLLVAAAAALAGYLVLKKPAARRRRR